MAGVIGLRGPDIAHRTRLLDFATDWPDAERPIIRPDTGCPVLRVGPEGPVVQRHVFGFTRRFSSFNARDDRLQDGKMWSRMFGRSHGIAPVSYILEWADLGDGEGRRPFRVERRDGAVMACPSLVGASWDHKGEPAFALCTTSPEAFFAALHDRTVCDCPDDLLDRWLSPQGHTSEELLECLRAPGNDVLHAIPLDKRLGRASHDDVDALQAAGEPITAVDLQKQGSGTSGGKGASTPDAPRRPRQTTL